MKSMKTLLAAAVALAAAPALAQSAPSDTVALVLDGEATIDCGGGARTFRPGDVLEVAADQPHTEHYGPKGYTFLLGRRHKAP